MNDSLPLRLWTPLKGPTWICSPFFGWPFSSIPSRPFWSSPSCCCCGSCFPSGSCGFCTCGATGPWRGISAHLPSSVIGSFHSLRIDRGWTSMSSWMRTGGRWKRVWKTRIASAYWRPRKISSSSLSRRITPLHAGSEAAIAMLSTVSRTINITRLYPAAEFPLSRRMGVRWERGLGGEVLISPLAVGGAVDRLERRTGMDVGDSGLSFVVLAGLGARVLRVDLFVGEHPAVALPGHGIDRHLLQIALLDELIEAGGVLPLVTVVLVDDVAQGMEIGLEHRLLGVDRYVLQGRHGDGRQDADDRHDDDQLEEGESLLARCMSFLLPHGLSSARSAYHSRYGMPFSPTPFDRE